MTLSLHELDIGARLGRFLDRRTTPKRLVENKTAATDEARALAAAISRRAPRGDSLSDWWKAFEGALGETGSAFWPTERDIKDAAEQVSRSRSPPPGPARMESGIDTYEVHAARMRAGAPVGEGFLYGREACELIRRGMVTQERMQAYRSGAYLNRREMYGEDKARAWEAEAKLRHDAARRLSEREDAAPRPDVSIPDKRMAGATPRSLAHADHDDGDGFR